MKKIFILSENTDRTTTDVMCWLYYYGYTCYRINMDDKSISIISITDKYLKIKTDFDELTIVPNDYVWARRFGFHDVFVSKESNEEKFQKKLFSFMERRDIWKSAYYWILNHCQFCVNPFSFTVNKINVLEYAMREGLKVPEWIVTNQKVELLTKMKHIRKVAAKPFNTMFYSNNGKTTKSITNCFSNKQLQSFPPQFPPMIFQEYIDKKYELRSFLFGEQIFTMAILSQKDKKTKIDFRNYNHEKPNMVCPYKMPKSYEKKLLHLSKRLNLFSGSFDILVDANDEYFFLEVNPIGQFGMVSIPCNYMIEKIIAEYIIKQITQ